jgi:hypothetical protein
MTDLAEVVVEPPTVVEVVEAAPPEVVEVNLGIKGDKGDPGDLGPTGPVWTPTRIDVTAPSASWVLPHNLGRTPQVQVFLSGGELVIADVVSGPSTVSVAFASAQTGFVILA